MQNKLIKCACGCGEKLSEWLMRTDNPNWKSRKRRFIFGHHNKGKFNAFYGKKHSEETKRELSKLRKGKYLGENHPNWKGGRRDTWTKKVKRRDNYICQICGLKDELIMQADHIKPIKKYPELKYILSNGQTLCPNCHARKSILDNEYHNKLNG